MIIPPKTYWEKIQKVCRKHDVLIVADEVICGFGRTGNMFGCETFDIKPDVMVVSKQLSSSYQPIAAILINDAVYQDIADQSQSIGTLGHGFTGSGHPVATAVALENLKIIEEEGLVQHAAEMGIILRKGLQQFADHPMVGEVRGVGLIAAVELVADRQTQEPFEAVGRLGRYLSSQTQERGMINRAMGDALAFCPPLISTEKDINEILGVFAASLDATQHWYLKHTAQ